MQNLANIIQNRLNDIIAFYRGEATSNIEKPIQFLVSRLQNVQDSIQESISEYPDIFSHRDMLEKAENLSGLIEVNIIRLEDYLEDGVPYSSDMIDIHEVIFIKNELHSIF